MVEGYPNSDVIGFIHLKKKNRRAKHTSWADIFFLALLIGLLT